MRSMKHSIKREQSHARMSFAEFENQRSLAEGESNVRATLKHMKLSFHLILTLAVMLTMAQTAWAATEEVTETWPMNGVLTISGSTLTNGNGCTMVLNNDMVWYNNNNRTSIKTSSSDLVTDSYNTEISFPNITGKVTKVELKTFAFARTGLCLYAGTSRVTCLRKAMVELPISPGKVNQHIPVMLLM